MSTVTSPEAPAPAEVHSAGNPPVSWKAPIIYGVVGLAVLILFGIMGREGDATFALASSGDFFTISPVGVSAQLASILLGVVCLGLSAFAAVRTRDRLPVPAWVPATFVVAVVLAFLTWAVAGSTIAFTGLLQGALFLAVPLVFGALGGVLCERAGVVNIAIEAQLLAGAFLAAVAASLTDNVYVGLIAAPIAGMLVGVLHAVFTVTYAVNQVIVGVVLNVLVVGVTSFLFSTLLKQDTASWNSPPGLQPISIPLLADIPVLGPVLFRQTIIVYAMYAAVVVIQLMLFRSRWGLRMRAVGEHPRAADTVGIKVNRTRFRSVMLGGAVAGFGGAFFTIGAGLAFGKEMTAGKGYIALAALIFGRWSPKGALGAALLFGFAEQLRISLGIAGAQIPSEFMAMTPYLVTILAVAGVVGKVRAPAASGTHYSKS